MVIQTVLRVYMCVDSLYGSASSSICEVELIGLDGALDPALDCVREVAAEPARGRGGTGSGHGQGVYRGTNSGDGDSRSRDGGGHISRSRRGNSDRLRKRTSHDPTR